MEKTLNYGIISCVVFTLQQIDLFACNISNITLNQMRNRRKEIKEAKIYQKCTFFCVDLKCASKLYKSDGICMFSPSKPSSYVKQSIKNVPHSLKIMLDLCWTTKCFVETSNLKERNRMCVRVFVIDVGIKREWNGG